ncbi:MAG: hypothetical protein KIT17_13630 [Rubrivivax sp.]|nr:hypothetical protein [Rubrivivax sp.]
MPTMTNELPLPLPRRRAVAVAAAAAAAVALAGCGGMPSFMPGSGSASTSGSATAAATAADTSPALPTAVRVVTLSTDGLAGFFPFEGTTTTATRADRQRDETTLRGTGTVSRFLLRDSGAATITRLDRKLVYALDIPRARYTECPLGGCPVPARDEPPRSPQQPQEPQSTREPGCTMKIASNKFDVRPTSQRKAINGFDTEQYAVDWSVVFEDPNKRRSTLQLTVDVWTTPVTPALRDAMAVETAYNRAASAAMQRALADRAAAMPPQLMETMNRYFAQSLTAADRTALMNAARQLERIRGEQILTQFKLFYRGEACGGAAGEEGGASPGRAGIAGALQGLFGGGGGGSGGSAGATGGERPLLTFTQEVKSWRVEPVRDSQFAPPPNFQRSNPG